MALDIPHTDRKLREAGYFLRCVCDKAAAPVGNPEEVLHLLSAFLSAGRSVTFVLQAEAKDEYDAWFPGWQGGLSSEEQRLLGAMNRHRVSELHRTGADVRAELRYVPITEIRTKDRRHPAYGFRWFGPPGTPAPTIGQVDHFVELVEGPEPVAESCRRFLLLQRLVREFKRAGRSGGREE